ncbi:15723_t:CDS:2 [Funneliformis geosporum]|uniref:15723_t:CDS:1 n=1 Tax=Funneliformis geosporum TaxID=1117311 RepID=A0A9W4WQ73_9GLOM|nr:15723_t:CDS:2 [Funneliformis geosporum]
MAMHDFIEKTKCGSISTIACHRFFKAKNRKMGDVFDPYQPVYNSIFLFNMTTPIVNFKFANVDFSPPQRTLNPKQIIRIMIRRAARKKWGNRIKAIRKVIPRDRDVFNDDNRKPP